MTVEVDRSFTYIPTSLQTDMASTRKAILVLLALGAAGISMALGAGLLAWHQGKRITISIVEAGDRYCVDEVYPPDPGTKFHLVTPIGCFDDPYELFEKGAPEVDAGNTASLSLERNGVRIRPAMQGGDK